MHIGRYSSLECAAATCDFIDKIPNSCTRRVSNSIFLSCVLPWITYSLDRSIVGSWMMTSTWPRITNQISISRTNIITIPLGMAFSPHYMACRMPYANETDSDFKRITSTTSKTLPHQRTLSILHSLILISSALLCCPTIPSRKMLKRRSFSL